MSPGRRSRPTVAVVGGGISGLAAAWALQQAPGDRRVVVVEQADRTGGVLRRQPLPGGPPGLRVDVGAEALLARRPEAVRLAEDVGLGADLVEPATIRAAIWSRGALYPMPRGTVMGVPGNPSALAGLLSAAEVARVAAEPETDRAPVAGDVDVASWVSQRVGPAVVQRLVEPLLGGVYAGHADRLSLEATVPALWAVARSGASAVEAAAASASGTASGPVFAGVRGGVARLAERLAALLAEAAEVRTRACVHAVEEVAGGFRLRLGPRPDPVVLDVDAVVLALPPRRAGRLLTGVVPAAAAELAAVRTASVALVTALLPPAALGDLSADGPLSGVLVPPVENRLVKAMTFSSRKWDWVREAAGGADVLRMSVGRDGEESVLQRPDAELAAAAVADASAMLGRDLTPTGVLVTRWGGALPQYDVGHRQRMLRVRDAVSAVPGLAVAGAAYDGVGVAACVAGAQDAAQRVRRHLG